VTRDTLADLAARLTEMEIRYMEQQAIIDALDGVVRGQDAEIAALAKEVARLQQALAGSDDEDAPWDE
jgi:uncharacterized coiled-coil protein SlyX